MKIVIYYKFVVLKIIYFEECGWPNSSGPQCIGLSLLWKQL